MGRFEFRRRYEPRVLEELPPPRRRWSFQVPTVVLFALLLLLLWRGGASLQKVDHTVRDAYYVALTRIEIHNVAEQVRLHHLAEQGYPVDFRGFLASFQRKRGPKPPWTDFWGQEYVLEPGPKTFDVRSAGPDHRYYTRDDLVARREILPKR